MCCSTLDRFHRSRTVTGALARLPEASFARVLVDAPCSALGVRPRLAISLDGGSHAQAALREYASNAKAILWSAVRLVAPGGLLCLSTCTPCPAEGESQCAELLRTYPHMRLVSADVGCGGPGMSGYGLSDADLGLVRRFGVNDKEEIGFFCAIFRRE